MSRGRWTGLLVAALVELVIVGGGLLYFAYVGEEEGEGVAVAAAPPTAREMK